MEVLCFYEHKHPQKIQGEVAKDKCFPIFRKVCPCLCLLPHLKTWSPPPHLPMAFNTHRCYSVFVCFGLCFYFICFFSE